MRRVAFLGLGALVAAACRDVIPPDAAHMPPLPSYVVSGPACYSPPSGLVHWWPGMPQPFRRRVLLDERFDVLDLDRWLVFGSGAVESQDGKLFVQSGTSGWEQSTGLFGQVFAGDFDVQVDFSDFEIFVPGFFGALTLRLESPAPGPWGFVTLERRSVAGHDQIFSDVAREGAAPLGFSATYADASGQLRISRVGSTITMQYRTSPATSFTTLATTAWLTDAVRVDVLARNDNFGTGVRGRFDNLTVVGNAADAIDLRGNNVGSLRGGSFVPGKVGSAIHLANGAVVLQSQPALTQGFTIEGWVRFDPDHFDAYQTIFNNNQLLLRKNGAPEGNTLAAFVTLADGGAEPRAESQTPLVPGVFHHVAATWNGDVLTVYVDGRPEGAISRPGPLTGTTALAQLGRGEFDHVSVNPLLGAIDELSIFDRALSAQEIRGIAGGAAGRCGDGRCVPPPPGVTGWWPGNGNTNDVVGGRNAVLRADATFGPGLVQQAFSLDGDGDFIEVPHDPALDLGSGDFALGLWVLFNGTEGEQILAEKYIERFDASISEGWTLTKLDGNVLLLAMADGFGGGTGVASDVLPIPIGTWIHFAATRRNGLVTLYMNGVPVASGDGSVNLNSTSSLKFGHRGDPFDTPGSQDERGFFLNGSVDEVELFVGAALTQRQIVAIVNAGSGGRCRLRGR